MRTPSGAAKRRVSEPVERARIEALVDRGVKVPRAYLAASRVAPDRTQKKLRIFDERRNGRIVVDFAGLQRDHPGALVRFQLRESGQVLGTAQWHVPDRPDEEHEAAGEQAPLSSGAPTLAASSAEVQRLREELAGVRGEARHLAEELRRLRSELIREQTARLRAEAERDVAREAEERGRTQRDALRDRLLKAAVGKKESEIAFRLLLDRVPKEMEEVSRLVNGRG